MSSSSEKIVEFHTMVLISLNTTSAGTTIFTSREEEIKKKTTKFIMNHRTIFEELSKL
jgi:hypothetical protein